MLFLLSHGAFFPPGLLSGGDFIRWGFYPWGFFLRGICPWGFCPWGFYPRGFCPTLHRIIVTVTGKRKREVGLVDSAKYTIYTTTEKRCDKILNMKLFRIKKSFTTFQFEYTEKLRHFTVPVFNEL